MPKNTDTISAIFLLLALGAHGFTEGMVLGNMWSGEHPAMIGTVFIFVFCICAHIWVEALILSQSLMKAKQKWMIWLAGIHMIINPLGFVFTKYVLPAIFSSPADRQMLKEKSPYVNAGAAGCLIYIAVTEIVPEVFTDTGHKRRSALKFGLFFLCGLFVIALTAMHSH